jgi:hypothetical protein
MMRTGIATNAACSCNGPSDTHRRTPSTPGWNSVEMSRSRAALPTIAHAHGLDREAVRVTILKPMQMMIKVRPAASCCPQMAGLTPLRRITRTPTTNAGTGASNIRNARIGTATGCTMDFVLELAAADLKSKVLRVRRHGYLTLPCRVGAVSTRFAESD